MGPAGRGKTGGHTIRPGRRGTGEPVPPAEPAVIYRWVAVAPGQGWGGTGFPRPRKRAEVAELADAWDLKSPAPDGACGLESRPRHQAAAILTFLSLARPKFCPPDRLGAGRRSYTVATAPSRPASRRLTDSRPLEETYFYHRPLSSSCPPVVNTGTGTPRHQGCPRVRPEI